jgi:4-amino-4-deoxy-L-arabinose transferase-like glycosyltransferase
VTTTLQTRVSHRGSTTTAWRPVARWEVLAVGAAMVVVAVIGVVAIGRDPPLLWDEAVYSLRVRDLVGAGARGQYWIEVRAPGLPVLLSPVGMLPGGADVLLNGDAVALRAACLTYAVVGVGLTWLIARLVLGPSVAAVAAWLLAIAPGWHDSSWQVMPDIPGAVLTLSAMAVVLCAARGARLSWWALLAAPLAGAATLVRYGAPLLLVPAVLAALLLRWRTAVSWKLRSLTVLALTAAAAGVVWFVPPVSGSTRPPVFIFTARQDEKAIPALASAADFLGALVALVGPVFGTLVIVGGGVAAAAALRRPSLRGPVIASGLIALSVLLLMLFGIAEYHVRYLTPCLPFLAILAAVGLTQLAERLPPGAVAGLAAAVAVAGVGVAADTGVDRANEMLRTFGPARAAYRDIAAATARPCVVLDNNPTAEWYTGCASFRIPRSRGALARTLPRAGVAPDEPVFVLLRNWPNVANPDPPVRELLEQVAVGAVDTSHLVTVLDMGSVEDVTARLERNQALDRP